MNDIYQSAGKRNGGLTLFFILLSAVLFFTVFLTARQETAASATPITDETVADAPGLRFGVNFISSAEAPADEQQYLNGLATGAELNRWPMYWFNIETNEGNFDWSRHDATVQADLSHGLEINAILLGTPGFYTTGLGLDSVGYEHPPRQGTLALQGPESATPRGLYESVFADGSDEPGAGKRINPANKWAVFVHTAVTRYRPGGILAQQNGWPAGVGITYWEMWNEPDLFGFWDASVEDYARLLKVGYLAARQADPGAQVLFGALANNVVPSAGHTDVYNRVMAIYDGDALAPKYGYFHDILATHSYFTAWQSWKWVFAARNTLAARGLDKPIWLNETGVPAWDDYPGPVWDSASALRATMQEQADFMLQSALYAAYAGADAFFHFQLYDGCGNQPQGTDFPPHNGELCDENGEYNGKPCAGDANGLFRNPTDAACFRQHPEPETPRPNMTAFQVLTKHFQGAVPYGDRQRVGATTCVVPGSGATAVPAQEWVPFYQPETRKRILGLWTLCGEEETAVVPATNPQGVACLVGADGTEETINAVVEDGQLVYKIRLPKATNRNPYPGMDPPINAFYPIGGRPYLLIEPDPGPALAEATAASVQLTSTPVPPPNASQSTYLPAIYGPLPLPDGACE